MTYLDMTKLQMKNRSISKVPKKELKEWWNDYESTATIFDKVWEVVQEIPKGTPFFAGVVTKKLRQDKEFKTTEARRVREKLQRLAEQNKIKFVKNKSINQWKNYWKFNE